MRFNAGVTTRTSQISFFRTNDDWIPARPIQRLREIEGAELHAAHCGGGFNEDYGVPSCGLHFVSNVTMNVQAVTLDCVPDQAVLIPIALHGSGNRKS